MLGLDWAITANRHAEFAYRYVNLEPVSTGRYPMGDEVSADSYIAQEVVFPAMYCW